MKPFKLKCSACGGEHTLFDHPAMTPTLNTWSSPEVARTWPEGSQVVWRFPLSLPNLSKHYRYGESKWHRPDWIGKDYPLDQPGQEFMLLELPLTGKGMA